MSKSSSTVCTNCKATFSATWIYKNGEWFCDSCASLSPANLEVYDGTKSFMRDQAHWTTDIKNRVRLKDGTVARFKKTREGLKRYG